MKRFSWVEEVKRHFGYEEFTAAELVRKTTKEKEKAHKSLWYMVNKGKVLEKNGDKYRLIEGEKEKKETKRSANIIRKAELLYIISKKFGDNQFTVQDAMEATGGIKITVYGQLQSLFESRFLKRLKPGVYTLSTKGHNKVASCYGTPHVEAEVKEEQKTPLLLEAPKPSGLLESIESTWEKDPLYRWVTSIITNSEGWTNIKESLIGRAALQNSDCRKILEEKAKEAIQSMMPK